MTTTMRRIGILASLALFCWGCGDPGKTRVVRLSDGQDLTDCRLERVNGKRDGDRLHATAHLRAGGADVSMTLNFAIGVPTRLESGRYRWQQDARSFDGAVAERSVTFLGGQSGPPSVGGSFDLLSAEGTPLYRVHMPVTELR